MLKVTLELVDSWHLQQFRLKTFDTLHRVLLTNNNGLVKELLPQDLVSQNHQNKDLVAYKYTTTSVKYTTPRQIQSISGHSKTSRQTKTPGIIEGGALLQSDSSRSTNYRRITLLLKRKSDDSSPTTPRTSTKMTTVINWNTRRTICEVSQLPAHDEWCEDPRAATTLCNYFKARYVFWFGIDAW